MQLYHVWRDHNATKLITYCKLVDQRENVAINDVGYSCRNYQKILCSEMPNVRFRSESILLKTRNGALGVESRFTPIRRLKTAAAAWTKNHRRRSAAACKPGGSKIICQYQVLLLPNLSLISQCDV